jgi:hypothetical protein
VAYLRRDHCTQQSQLDTKLTLIFSTKYFDYFLGCTLRFLLHKKAKKVNKRFVKTRFGLASARSLRAVASRSVTLGTKVTFNFLTKYFDKFLNRSLRFLLHKKAKKKEIKKSSKHDVAYLRRDHCMQQPQGA